MTYKSLIRDGAQALQLELAELRHRFYQRPEIGLHLPAAQAMVLSPLDGFG